jgi:hypothetical protein
LDLLGFGFNWIMDFTGQKKQDNPIGVGFEPRPQQVNN